MPVTISDQESLALFFTHLEGGGTHDVDFSKGKQPLEASSACEIPNQLYAFRGQEPHYRTSLAEFEKEILYEDGRVDLCKM